MVKMNWTEPTANVTVSAPTPLEPACGAWVTRTRPARSVFGVVRGLHLHDEPLLAQQNGNQFTFQPEADAMLRQNQTQPLGLSSALSAGNWSQSGTSYQNVSVMRFEIGPLLEEMHRNPQKKLLRATLYLHANSDDKLYGQGVSNQEPAGHSSKGGDNAFYLKPVHNNFDETGVTWDSFFNQSNYTPTAIRSLPEREAMHSNQFEVGTIVSWSGGGRKFP